MTHQVTIHDPTTGRGGLIAPENKKEGDSCTPLGTYPLREIWYRPDRVEKPISGLPIREITTEDCWCDDAEHVLYNRHFHLSPSPIRGEVRRGAVLAPLCPSGPHPNPPPKGEGALLAPASFEHLWREDGAYDLIVVIGYNDAPTIPGKGSAIFIHCMHDDGRPTAGCVALKKSDLLQLISGLNPTSKIQITENDVSII